MSKKIINDLQSLLLSYSPEELEEVIGALQHLSKSKEKKIKSGGRKQQRRKKLDQQKNESILMSKGESKRNKNKINSRVKKKDENFNLKSHRKKRSQGRKTGAQSRTEAVDLNKERENLFFKEGLHGENPDRDKDALLYNKPPTKRRKSSSMIEAECDRCGVYQTISTKLLTNTESGEPTFICDNCILSMR